MEECEAKQTSCDLNTIVLGAGIEVHSIGINLSPLYAETSSLILGNYAREDLFNFFVLYIHRYPV